MPLTFNSPPYVGVGPPHDPAILRAQCAGHQATASALVPLVAGAVDAYRHVLVEAQQLPTEPVDAFNDGFTYLMDSTGAGDLRHVLGELLAIVATVDQPATP
jgi:hypothetical protein